jgi:DNA-binding winged helix-turn-helix (wHTH) protein/Flp pilus assembly protein TadD
VVFFPNDSPLVAMQSPPSQHRIARFGVFEVDIDGRVLTRGGLRVRLQDQPFSVLALLLEHPGEIVSREAIRQKLWSADTYVEFDDGLNTAIKKLRTALGDAADNPRFVETIPRRGYRFLAPVTFPETVVASSDSEQPPAPDQIAGASEESSGKRQFPRRELAWAGAGALVLFLVFGALGLRESLRPKPAKLTQQDMVVLADFVNTTGEPVFTDALKQALSVELGQSPFLNVASGVKVSDTLRNMGRSPNDPVTREAAMEICQRLGSRAILTGSISNLGSHYVVGLEALGCGSGDTLAKDQTEAPNKESVLKALNQVASHVRGQLGESLPSQKKFDLPVDATTSSLEALKAYSLGAKTVMQTGEAEAIPFFQHATQLDPNFALSYEALGTVYDNMGEEERANENYSKAYSLRDRLSERERDHIAASYHSGVTGDMEKAREACELWTHSYPRDPSGHSMLGVIYATLGQLERASTEYQEALRLNSEAAVNYGNSAVALIALGRLDEAKASLDTALAQKLDGIILRENEYSLAFLRGDSAEMARQVAWAEGKPGAEDQLLSQQSDTEAYYGRLGKARELSRRAVSSALRNGAKETAATWQINAALRETEVGNRSLARQGVRAALALAPTRDVKTLAALILARTGDASGAKRLIQELENRNPDNTMLKFYWLPTLRASLAVEAGNSEAAVSLLQTAAPYELGEAAYISNIYPAYVRGQAYLLADNGAAASAEFQKMIDHPGIVQNDILGPMSRLQLARAKAMAGDRDGAKKQYQDFFSLWKDADRDLPILVAAQVEYRKL